MTQPAIYHSSTLISVLTTPHTLDWKQTASVQNSTSSLRSPRLESRKEAVPDVDFLNGRRRCPKNLFSRHRASLRKSNFSRRPRTRPEGPRIASRRISLRCRGVWAAPVACGDFRQVIRQPAGVSVLRAIIICTGNATPGILHLPPLWSQYSSADPPTRWCVTHIVNAFTLLASE